MSAVNALAVGLPCAQALFLIKFFQIINQISSSVLGILLNLARINEISVLIFS